MTLEHGVVHHIIAAVTLLKSHPEESYFRSCCIVTCNDMETDSSMRFIPVQRLLSRCAFGNVTITTTIIGTENVVVAIPIPFKFCI